MRSASSKVLRIRHEIIYRVGLVAVGDNGVFVQHPDRVIDDQGWIGQLGRVECLRPDSVAVLDKDAVSEFSLRPMMK